MYEAYYRLTAKPFRLSPDPRFFFNSKGHKRALSYLRYGVKQGEGFIIITGDVGTGKTTLVGALLTMLERENVVATQIVTTQMQGDDLLKMVAAGYGLPYQRVGKAAMLRGLESFFRGCMSEGKRALLIVDEAQGLPRKAIEELRMLSNFQDGNRPLLQSFLLGQREFRTTMRSEGFEQLRQRVIAAYHLRPLDAAETRGYIEYRLQVVGWKNDPLIDEDVYQGIYHFSEGVPRRINTFCDRLFLYAHLEELHRINRAALEAVTRELVEEQGGGDSGEYALASLREQAPAPSPGTSRRARSAAPRGSDTDRRLEAMETSMASLTGAMREELALLRKALMGQIQPRREKEEP